MTYAIDAYAGSAYALTEDSPTTEPFPIVPYPCPCGSKWRVYSCSMKTGRIRTVLRPIAIDVQTILNGVGQGSLTFPTRGVKARDIWPGLTSIFIVYDDEVVFPGYIEAFDANSTVQGGTATVGVKTMNGYLYRRTIKSDLTLTGVAQTAIGSALVAQALPNGIPLVGQPDVSSFTRDRAYLGAERPYIGEQIEALVNSIDGPDWTLLTDYAGNSFTNRMLFQDRAGVDRDSVFKSDREGAEYGLTVDATNIATNVDGFGDAPEDDDPTIVNANDPANIYPQWDATPAFGTIVDEDALLEETEGYLRDNREPYAAPSFTLAGDAVPISDIRLGDTAEFHINQSAVTFHGRAKVVGITYRGSQGKPLERILGLEPVDRASDSVLNAVTTDECPVCR